MKKIFFTLLTLIVLLAGCGEQVKQANIRIVSVVNKETQQAISGVTITLKWEYPDGGGRKESYTEKDLPISVKLPQDGKYRLIVKAQAAGYKDFEIVVRLKMEKEKFLEVPIEMEPEVLPPST